MDLTILKNRDLVKKQLSEMEPAYTPSFHHFTDGLYTRETHMPAGAIAIGEKHRYRVTNILVAGHITVINGDETKDYIAPCIFESEAGVSKIAYFHTDTVWLNCHPTTETDLEKIKQDVIISENELIKEI